MVGDPPERVGERIGGEDARGSVDERLQRGGVSTTGAGGHGHPLHIVRAGSRLERARLLSWAAHDAASRSSSPACARRVRRRLRRRRGAGGAAPRRPRPRRRRRRAPSTPASISKDLTGKPQIAAARRATPPTELQTDRHRQGQGQGRRSRATPCRSSTSATRGRPETQFDASWDRGGEPFQFPLGAGQVIPGWDQGVAGMKAGGRRLLVIPPELAYGAQSPSPDIAPERDADLRRRPREDRLAARRVRADRRARGGHGAVAACRAAGRAARRALVVAVLEPVDQHAVHEPQPAVRRPARSAGGGALGARGRRGSAAPSRRAPRRPARAPRRASVAPSSSFP